MGIHSITVILRHKTREVDFSDKHVRVSDFFGLFHKRPSHNVLSFSSRQYFSTIPVCIVKVGTLTIILSPSLVNSNFFPSRNLQHFLDFFRYVDL